jgi:hypothetical protein
VNFDAQLITLIVGLIFVGLGIAVRLGTWKGWYWRTRGGVYGYIPMGIMFMVYAYQEALFMDMNVFIPIILYSLLGILVVFLSLRPPRWVKPAWILWLEELPKASLKAIHKAVNDGDEWQSHVSSQRDVQDWAKSLKK